MSYYHQELSKAAQEAGLKTHREMWHDEVRRVWVSKQYFYYETAMGTRDLIATAKEYEGYEYEYSVECSRAIRTIQDFMKWV